MNALANIFSAVDSKMPIYRRPLFAVLFGLALAFALPAPALAQHAGGAHAAGGGGAHAGGGHAAGGGRGYGGRGYYGRGYYGGWGGWWGGWWDPWAFGAFLPVLPWYYETYWWNGVPYYYADDTYYQWNAGAQGYVTVAPPGGSAEAAPGGAAPPSTEVFAYPMKGQTPAQQSRDRAECQRWAADQAGFDPSQATGAGPAQEAMAKRAEYMRAQGACLTGRGYSVK